MMKSQKRRLRIQSLEARQLLTAGPYAPAAEIEGSTAIARDDAAIVGWATGVAEYSPGANVTPDWSSPAQALGPAEGEFDRVVSLGRGGTLTVTFDEPIRDGLGFDFAVFENSFSDTFLEFGFVEVSSDGINFTRFDAASLTGEPVASFGETDPTNVNNLAGKHRGGFGTPFDLQELRGRTNLDVTAITHVRIVDIVGNGTTLDASGRPIYDPTPTVESAGIDIDGVAVLHEVESGQVVVDFEDLGEELGVNLSDNGETRGGEFVEAELTLNNSYDTNFGSWTGWSISKATDTATAGYLNQYSAFTGSGHGGSDTYAVGFFDSMPSDAQPAPRISIDPSSGSRFDSLWITNTTYAALSMQNGDSFAKKFGGSTGNDPDYLSVLIVGEDAQGNSLGDIEVNLADFRFTDNSQDYILDTWQQVDLSSLAHAASLRFEMTSSDNSAFGLNTPAYFAIDSVGLRRAAVPLDLDSPIGLESEPMLARVSRPTLDQSKSVTVELSALPQAAVSLPTSVTIPIGQDYVDFVISPLDDAFASADVIVDITAQSSPLLPTTRTLTIQDDEPLALSFNSTTLTLGEGATTPFLATLSRNDADLSSPLTVTLMADANGLLSFPSTVTFDSAQRHQTVSIRPIDNDRFEGDRIIHLRATADNRQSASLNVTLTDNDVPRLQVSPSSATLNEDDPGKTVTLTVSRNTANLAEAVEVAIRFPEGGPISAPDSVTIPAGQSQASVHFTVIDDDIQNANSTYPVLLSNQNFASATASLGVIDNDTVSLSLTFLDENNNTLVEISEGESFRIQVQRYHSDLGTDMVVSLSNNLMQRLSGPATITIPAGSATASANYFIAGDSVATGSQTLQVTAMTSGVESTRHSLVLLDRDVPRLHLSPSLTQLSESNAITTVEFDSFGTHLLNGQADNNAGPDSGFVSSGLTLSNSFDDSLGYEIWSGFALSKATDTTTPGFSNQYSAITGAGARQSETYAIAYASSPTQIYRASDAGRFDTISITNTTYAALSMRDGDSFAKRFGGQSGEDPDFLLLTIEGLDSQNNSIGSVDFYLADYRFADSADDYIVEDWSIVDISSLGEATTLSMSLTSSDVGSFGINTPAYFAIDDVTLINNDDTEPTLTVSRELADTTEAITVALSSDHTDVRLPESVTIPAGRSSVSVPIRFLDNSVAENDRNVTLTADAESFDSASTTITLLNDDILALNVAFATSHWLENQGEVHIDFEDVGQTLAENTFDNGSNQRGGFHAGPFMLATDYDPNFGSWSGWSASNVSDVTTPGFTNQFAAYTSVDSLDAMARGANGSFTYAVANGYGASPPMLSLPDSLSNHSFASIDIANTTYAALSMLQGDAFAKKFGGETGDDADFLLLTIEGLDQQQESIGAIEFYLADYRFEDNSLDTIVDDWTSVDLTSIADAKHLRLGLSSSDNSSFGMNTPAYFAVDNVILTPNHPSRPGAIVSRNNVDLSTPLTVSMSSSQPVRAELPAEIEIPAGVRSVFVPVKLTNDAIFNSSSSVIIQAESNGYVSGLSTTELVDDERPSVRVANADTNLMLTEGILTQSIQVQLEAAPTQPVSVTLLEAPSSTTSPQLHFSSTEITFTPENWDQLQMIEVGAVADFLIEPESVYAVDLAIRNVDPQSNSTDQYAPFRIYAQVTDYQASFIALALLNDQLQLFDNDNSITFETYTNDSPVAISLNDADQTLTLMPIGQSTNLTTVDVLGGDDRVVVQTNRFDSIDGGSGFDELVIDLVNMQAEVPLYLAAWLRDRIVGFESIVLGTDNSTTPSNGQHFHLDANELHDVFGNLIPQLSMPPGQKLTLQGDWSLGEPIIADQAVTQRLHSGDLEVRVSTTVPYQNPMRPEDVNANGDVTAADALVIINWLNNNATPLLPLPTSPADILGHFYDVSGDGRATAADALQIINWLNSQPLEEADAGNEPIATMAFSGGWQRPLRQMETDEFFANFEHDTVAASSPGLAFENPDDTVTPARILDPKPPEHQETLSAEYVLAQDFNQAMDAIWQNLDLGEDLQ